MRLPRGDLVRGRTLVLPGLALLLAAGLTLMGERLAASQGTILTALTTTEDVPLAEPFDGFWDRLPEAQVPLSAQQTAPPMGGGRLTMQARAVHDAERLYVLVEWPDEAPDRSVDAVDAFSDAVAVQFPVGGGQQVPSFCMGDPGAAVNIWQWRASTQRDIEEGVARAAREAHPRTVSDEYPFHGEDVFYPGRYLDNPVSETEPTSPVENLVAGGFGSLTGDADRPVAGWGEWREGAWRVVFSRPLDVGAEGHVRFGRGLTDVAFAVWDGAAMERDGVKSVANFLTLRVSGEELPGGPGSPWALVSVAVLLAWLGVAALFLSDLRWGART